MFYKKPGLPEVGELVLCTVKKILFHSVFVELDEYQTKEGLIHISEVSPGRIRNLRDFVKEEKKIVCKVLRINKEGNIDLSLRRVTTNQKLKRVTEIKQEEKAEKLLQYIGEQLKKDLKKMYEEVGTKAIEEFGSLNNFFLEIVVNGRGIVDNLKLPKATADILFKIVKEKISTPEVKVSATISLKSFSPNGIVEIKHILLKYIKDNVNIIYLGAPKYRIEVTAPNYKEAEIKLKDSAESIVKEIKKIKGDGEYHKIAA